MTLPEEVSFLIVPAGLLFRKGTIGMIIMTLTKVAASTKTCSKCGEEKSLANFYEKASNKDGFDSRCKGCFKAYNQSREQTVTVDVKFCPYCLETKKASEFPKDPSKSNGLKGLCKACHNAKKRGEKITKKTPEQIMLAEKVGLDHALVITSLAPGKICADCEEYKRLEEFYFSSSGRCGVDSKCIECRSIQTKAYRISNPEKARERNANRRARLKGLHKEDVRLYDLLERDGSQCAWCGQVPESIHVDHFIPLNRGGWHCRENTLISCGTCNTQKGSLEPQDFIDRQIGLGRTVKASDRVLRLMRSISEVEGFEEELRNMNFDTERDRS